MATVLDVDDTNMPLDEVYARALGGEELIIRKGTGLRFKLVPAEVPPTPRRQAGTLKGLISSRPEHFAPLTDEELKDWGY